MERSSALKVSRNPLPVGSHHANDSSSSPGQLIVFFPTNVFTSVGHEKEDSTGHSAEPTTASAKPPLRLSEAFGNLHTAALDSMPDVDYLETDEALQMATAQSLRTVSRLRGPRGAFADLTIVSSPHSTAPSRSPPPRRPLRRPLSAASCTSRTFPISRSPRRIASWLRSEVHHSTSLVMPYSALRRPRISSLRRSGRRWSASSSADRASRRERRGLWRRSLSRGCFRSCESAELMPSDCS